MRLERNKMQPLVKQIVNATLVVLPISVVVAGAVIQIASALFDTNYWMSLFFVWISTGCFTGALVFGLWYESIVDTGGEQYLDRIPKEESRLFWATILVFGLGLLFFLISPAGILGSDESQIEMILGVNEAHLQPGETITVGVIVKNDKSQFVQIQTLQPTHLFQINYSHDELHIDQSGLATFYLTITSLNSIPNGFYPVAISIFPKGESVSSGTTNTILIEIEQMTDP